MRKPPPPNEAAKRSMEQMFKAGRNTAFDAAIDMDAVEKRRRIEEHQERLAAKESEL